MIFRYMKIFSWLFSVIKNIFYSVIFIFLEYIPTLPFNNNMLLSTTFSSGPIIIARSIPI